MRQSRTRRWLALTAAATLSVATAYGSTHLIRAGDDTFDHPAHAKLFPDCVTCHAGAAQPGAALWPQPVFCEVCHDGAVQERITWEPRTSPPRTNLRFDHERHADALTDAISDAAQCVDCHSDLDAPWMSVRLAAVEQCLDCHDIGQEHLVAPDSACGTCHLPLANAARLLEEDIAAFAAPPSHDDGGFGIDGEHGTAAAVEGGGIAQSCATCHARDYCLVCHVDAPEQPTIQALGTDPRSLAIPVTLEAPATHESADFLVQHGQGSRGTPSACLTCHTQESCIECHIATQQVASTIHRAAPGRSAGAVVERERPASHDSWFRSLHGDEAASSSATCAGCHARQDCLDCHRPDPASGPPGYHRDGFLSEHPAASYDRVTSCSDCHNPGAFCATCHQSAGLTNAGGQLGAGYHDAQEFFIVGHGPAARQNLETCVSCHTERDCLTCHSASGGRRINPHGPGFDAERLARRASQMCTVCHLVVPG